jgi:hypothetical protein
MTVYSSSMLINSCYRRNFGTKPLQLGCSVDQTSTSFSILIDSKFGSAGIAAAEVFTFSVGGLSNPRTVGPVNLFKI